MAGVPMALKLYGLKLILSHVPLPVYQYTSWTTNSRTNPLCQHLSRQIRFFLDEFLRELGTLGDPEADHLLHLDQLALPQISQDLGIRVCASALNRL